MWHRLEACVSPQAGSLCHANPAQPTFAPSPPALSPGYGGEGVASPPLQRARLSMPFSSPLPRRRAPWLGYALAATGAILFSTKSILIKLAYAEGVTPEAFLALRMALSLPFYVAIG